MKTLLSALIALAVLTGPVAAMSVSMSSLTPRLHFPDPRTPDVTRDIVVPRDR